MHPATFRLFCLGLVCTSFLYSENWPTWRGPFGTGVSPEKQFPTKWSHKENIRWRISLVERGNSSPVIWGDKVFVTQSIEKTKSRQLICINRVDGKTLWARSVKHAEMELTHRTNPFCSASPVTDGERVIVSHASAGMFCYDMDGKELWRRNLGEQRHIWGNGASPLIYKGLCILNFGPGKRTFLVAVNKSNGTTVWQHDELGGHTGEKKEGEGNIWVGSRATPIIIKSQEKGELLMSYPNRIVSFDPSNGKEVWNCKGLNPLVYTSPIYENGIVVAIGGFRGTAMAVRTGGKGDVTDTHQLWTRPKEKQRIGSGVLANGYIYILNEDGVAQCIEAKQGKVVWEERLRGPGGNGKSWSSMVVAGDKLYAINQSGDAFILRAAPRYQLLAVNSLGEMTQSSMAFSGGEIFVRTYNALWCITKND